MTQTQIDLRGLALERTSTATPSKNKLKQPWLSRYVIPGVIMIGFIGLLVIATSEQFLSRQPVTVIPVIVKRAEIQQEGTPLFQAAGWVEPRPTSVNVPALTEGVVKELLVVEGQEVKYGEPVATLIDVDAKISLRQAETQRELRKAELQSAQAQLKAAQLRVDNPVHLEAALAEAQSVQAQTETSIGKLPYLIESAKARLEYAQKNFDGKRAAVDAIAGRLIQQAQSEFATAKAELEELKQRSPRLKRESQALLNKVVALSTQRKLLIEESRQLEDARAQMLAARARVNESELRVEIANLNLERTIVRSPIGGRVLRLVAAPGTRVMGLKSASHQSSSTIMSLYNPKMLQVRADVRLEDVPLVQPGQPVEIQTASSSVPIVGKVLLPTSSANIQKNTLEVKVAIDNPTSMIRPEMLVTATFLSPPQLDPQENNQNNYERILIPRELALSTEGGHITWVVDVNGTANKRAIKLGKAGTEELVEVVEGINPTDKLISSGSQGLELGMRVTITGEDTRIGTGKTM